jgi:hypothetical protein
MRQECDQQRHGLFRSAQPVEGGACSRHKGLPEHEAPVALFLPAVEATFAFAIRSYGAPSVS